MLIKMLQDEQPTHVAVAFDRSEPTFRHEQYVEYKANRKETPGDLRSQFGLIFEVLDALGIARLVGARLRGRRHHRHAGQPGGRRGHGRAHRHRRPRRAAAGQPACHRADDPPRHHRDDPLHPGGGRRQVRPHPGAVPGLRRDSRRPQRQPAEHPRGGGEDRRQVDRRLRLAGPARRPGRRGQGQGGGQAPRAPRRRAAQPAAHRARPRRAAGGRPAGPAAESPGTGSRSTSCSTRSSSGCSATASTRRCPTASRARCRGPASPGQRGRGRLRRGGHPARAR